MLNDDVDDYITYPYEVTVYTDKVIGYIDKETVS